MSGKELRDRCGDPLIVRIKGWNFEQLIILVARSSVRSESGEYTSVRPVYIVCSDICRV